MIHILDASADGIKWMRVCELIFKCKCWCSYINGYVNEYSNTNVDAST